MYNKSYLSSTLLPEKFAKISMTISKPVSPIQSIIIWQATDFMQLHMLCEISFYDLRASNFNLYPVWKFFKTV